MKAGYKKTKLGVIPEDWEVKKLSSISKVIMGQSPPSSTYNDEGEGIPFFQGKTEFGKTYPKIMKWCTEPKKLSEMNDVLISVRAPVGDVNINNVQACIGRGLAAVRNNKRSNYKYLYYQLQNLKNRLERVSQGSTFTAINTKDLRNLKVPLPDIEEQQKIASILSSVDEYIEDIDRMVEDLQELKKGLMQKLLRGQWRIENGELRVNKDFKKTKLGMIPEGWEVKSIKQVADTTSGGTPKRSNKEYYNNGNIPWVKTGELVRKYINSSEEYITELAVEKSSAKIIPKNSVLIAMYGATIGKVGILNIEATTNQACCAILCNNKIVNQEYLYYYLKHVRRKVISLGAGGAQPNISQIIIKNYNIPVPPLEEQEKIASILSSVDGRIENYREEREDFRELKKGLMQKLLTGQIRVRN